MKIRILTCLCLLSYQIGMAQMNVDSISNLPYNQFVNDIWGYVAADGTEYALVGTRSGLSIVSLADPTSPTEVDFVPGTGSTWRDIKTWGTYAYVTTEAADGLQVVNLANLPNEVSHYFWKPKLESEVDSFRTCHNLYIDENGYCYLAGSNLNNGGFLIADIFTDPLNPTIVGKGPAIYSHDMYVRDNVAYSSDVETGNLTIHDVSNKDSIYLLGMTQTPFAFTHNAWLSDDGNTVFTTDERGNAPTAAYDISDLQDIKELDQFIPAATAGLGVIPHNVHVINDFLAISHYGDGLIIVDAHRPSNLVEVGNFDSSPLGVAGFTGAWGAYPFLPSGLVLISDSENGLFVVRPSYQRAAYLEGIVTDASGQGVFGVNLSMANTSTTTDLMGVIKTGLPESGTYEALVEKRGFISQTVTVELKEGEVTPFSIALEAAPSYSLSGIVALDEEGQPIEGVTIQLVDGPFSEGTISNTDGYFSFENVLASNYTILAGKWGYSTVLTNLSVAENQENIAVQLEKSIEDPFAMELGWTTTSENQVVGGGFEWGVPVLSNQLPFINTDVIGDIGESCYLTANAETIPENLFIFGRTELASPLFDLSAMTNPTLSYSTIYGNLIFTEDGNLLTGQDTFFVYLGNGIEEVVIDEITTDFDADSLTLPLWRESLITVKDFITPTDSMQIRFELSSDNFDVVFKAGVDDFKAFDASTVSTNEYIRPSIAFSAAPNPFKEQLFINYEISDWEEQPQLVLMDALGRTVHQQYIDPQQTVRLPATLSKGIYFAQLRNREKGSVVLKLVK